MERNFYLNLIRDPDKEREYKKLAKKTIIEDLYDDDIHGKKRAVSLEFYEDEKAFGTFFIPGCFYIFRHDGEILKMQDSSEFHDVIPIFLTLKTDYEKGSGLKYTFGINFNILPKAVRAVLLQELTNIDESFFDNILKERLRGRHGFSKVLVKAFVADGGMNFLNYICRKYNINKQSFAFRKYYIKNLSKVRLIDYWQWKYLPFIDVDEGVRGVELKKLQKDSINK